METATEFRWTRLRVYDCQTTPRSATDRRRVVPKRSESPVRRDWTCRSADNRGYTVTSRDSEFQKPHGGVVPPSSNVDEGSLLPAVATQPPGQFALRSMATHDDASTLTYNWVQLMTLDRAPWRTDISPALDGGSFEHFKTSVRPPPLLAPSGARRHSPTVVSALCGAQLPSFTVFEPPLSADKNRQCVIVALQRLDAVFEIPSHDWWRSSHDCLRFCTLSHP